MWFATTSAMSTERISQLRQETVEMFYHGFDNYMKIAFPEDEASAIFCLVKLEILIMHLLVTAFNLCSFDA